MAFFSGRYRVVCLPCGKGGFAVGFIHNAERSLVRRLIISSQEMAHLETKQTTLEKLALALNLSEILLIVENQVVILLWNGVY